jgi:transcriptional regulator with PAS, ATPase and Fis domain
MVQQIVDGTSVIFQYARDIERLYHILDAPAVVIDHKYRIVSINQSMCGLASTEEKDARGRRCFEIVHGLSVVSENCPFSTVRDSGKHTSRHIYLESLDSHFLVTTYPVFGADNIFVGALCVLNELAGWKDFEQNMADVFTLRNISVCAFDGQHGAFSILSKSLWNSDVNAESGNWFW